MHSDARTCYHANCQYGCEVSKGVVRCTCPSPGLQLGPDKRTCVGETRSKNNNFIFKKLSVMWTNVPWDFYFKKFNKLPGFVGWSSWTNKNSDICFDIQEMSNVFQVRKNTKLRILSEDRMSTTVVFWSGQKAGTGWRLFVDSRSVSPCLLRYWWVCTWRHLSSSQEVCEHVWQLPV